jgi:hypothetical protein
MRAVALKIEINLKVEKSLIMASCSYDKPLRVGAHVMTDMFSARERRVR